MLVNKPKEIALALSGGGVRAMVFHLGVIKFLAEENLLERVSNVSTVSGGSLLIGLLLQNNKMSWPTSQDFIQRSLPYFQENLCTRNMMTDILLQLRYPKNWKYLFSRANLLSKALKTNWGVNAQLSELPSKPEISINGTTAETGKRFRFKKENIGEYVLGYSASEKFSLSDALAVSAAFPGGIGPLVIEASKKSWFKRKWGEPIEKNSEVVLPYKRLHLYDGGVYDNLGIEPFFDNGNLEKKPLLNAETKIIVSDAGAPLVDGFSLSKLNPKRLKRVADIMSEQSRALRVRSFMSYLNKGNNGAYYCIKESISNLGDCESASFASNFPTTLRKLKNKEFETLLNHGYQVAKKISSRD
ncbi:patatin-like phospholipase family protein [Kangiella sp. HZ709]|uniref:patatin-like phospholipase family protein n=1 Tax=Kangiella sp. HZ709 TaxID=2666328 RepID=UPI0012AFCBB1|nr:patatin-like phospholipase family protein [Kangiella sp. HZ709]MRX27293.1 patatin-like phospholipase family protein [Kangiella sp. HZ709]